jgi:hypothetical protein
MIDALTFGPSGGLRFSRNTGRSMTSEALGAIRYPSPFFDIAHTYLPSSFKTMLRWCRYYYLTNPLINAVVTKMAEYPVTDLVFDTKNEPLRNQWEYCFNTILNFKKFEVEAGLDYNCFHGDVLAVTKDGVFKLRDLVGKTVEVLSQDGIYRPASFKSFGRQKLLEVEFSDGSTVLATPDHEWPVITQYDKVVRRKTVDLPCGDSNYALIRNVAPRPEKNLEFYEGVRHGFVFGDGTLYNDGKQAKAYFCGTKDKEMLKYFEGVGGDPYEDKQGVVMIHGLPALWKSLPEASVSPSYWYGFVCGFLASDGSVDVNGCVVLTQNSRTTLEIIKNQLPRIGMAAGTVRGYERSSGYDTDKNQQFYLSLLKQFVEPGDLLLSSHRRKFEENFKPTKYSKYAHVTAIRETGLVDEVFCCVEPETHTFTLANGVLTGNCYGNAFISLAFPFQKLVICKRCGFKARVEKQKYIFREYKFVGECQRCGHHQEFQVRDFYTRSVRDIRLIRWNPEYITVQHNEATGDSRYYYVIPPMLANDVRMAKRHVIEHIPQVFVEALRQNKAILFNRDNIYHMKRPTIAQKDKGWGMPMILPVLKDTFYLQVLRKAQEAIAVEHIVPLRLLFPQTSSPDASVYSTVNLTQWRDKVEQEIVRWRLDNNYIPILPVPMGQQTLGGDGRALMLAQEYRVWAEHIVAGMGVPIEFIWGGMSYSGSNVSLRILENHFLDQKTQHKQLVVDFVMPNIAAFMGWETTPIHYKRFKMADDLQRSALFLQMNQAGKLSDRSLLEDMDWNARREAEIIAEEQKTVLENQRTQALAQAGIQGEAQLVQVKYQTRAQKVMMEQQARAMAPEDQKAMAEGGMAAAGQPGVASPTAQGAAGNAQMAMMNQTGQIPPMELPQEQESPTSEGESPLVAKQPAQIDVMQVANKVVGWLNQLPEHEKQKELVGMQRNNPHLYSLVLQLLQQARGANRSSSAMPLPQQRPPMRGPEAAMV